MKIEDGQIKPCSKCYKARQAIRDALALASGKARAPYIRVVTTQGEITINNTNRQIAYVAPRPDTPGEGWGPYVGRRVYLAGRSVIDVALAARIEAFGMIVRSFPVDEIASTA